MSADANRETNRTGNDQTGYSERCLLTTCSPLSPRFRGVLRERNRDRPSGERDARSRYDSWKLYIVLDDGFINGYR